MDYQESIEYISSHRTSATRLGLSGMRDVLNMLNSPDKQLEFIHIAGTNGKGSISKITQSILTDAGYKTGLFISPYVIKYNERMQVDNEMISDETLSALATTLKYNIDNYVSNGGNKPNEFEVTTLLAMLYFSKSGCDIVCLEVGLGGLLDPTNVISCPIVSVICAIDFDHSELLGDNVLDIAKQKCGIIKGGITVMYPIQKQGVLKVVSDAVSARNGVLIVPKAVDITYYKNDWQVGEFTYKGNSYKKSLIGKHQVYNSTVVIEIINQLINIGWDIRKENVSYGICNTVFPARQEILSSSPLVMLDGAHNVHGVNALADTISKIKDKRIILAMAMMADKEYSNSLDILLPFADKFISVGMDNERALTADYLAEIVRNKSNNTIDVTAVYDIKNDIISILDTLGKRDMLIICGSLYLASEVRIALLKHYNT